MLDSSMFLSAMQKNANNRGVTFGYLDRRYSNGFWARNFKETLDCAEDVWLPIMSGFGGITVLPMHNNTTYYYVSDNAEYKYFESVKESNKIRALCNKNEKN